MTHALHAAAAAGRGRGWPDGSRQAGLPAQRERAAPAQFRPPQLTAPACSACAGLVLQGPVYWIDCADSQPCVGCAGAAMWTMKVTGKLFHSGLPHKVRVPRPRPCAPPRHPDAPHSQGINALELGMDAVKRVQDRFYADFPAHPEEARYNFATASTLKPTQIRVGKGSVNQVRACRSLGVRQHVDAPTRCKDSGHVRDPRRHPPHAILRHGRRARRRGALRARDQCGLGQPARARPGLQVRAARGGRARRRGAGVVRDVHDGHRVQAGLAWPPRCDGADAIVRVLGGALH